MDAHRYPAKDFSVTITRSNDHVTPGAYTAIVGFANQHSIKHVTSLEIGTRKQQRHVQGVWRLHLPDVGAELKKFKQALRANAGFLTADGHTVRVVPLAANQDFPKMVGYVLKDRGKAHFQSAAKNMLNEELLAGIRLYAVAALSPFKDRIIISKGKFMEMAYVFCQETLPALLTTGSANIPGMGDLLLWMHQVEEVSGQPSLDGSTLQWRH